LRASFVAPSGARSEVVGFLWQDFERRLEKRGEEHKPVEVEILTPRGAPEWRIRFAPGEAGTWRYSVGLAVGGRTTRGPAGEFACLEGPSPGFVRVSQADRRYLCFDSGEPFFIIGHNVCWPGSRGTFDYDDWLPRMSAAGENFFRLWLVRSDACTLEVPRDRDTGLGGAGSYRLDNAWRVDRILDLAAQHNLRVMLCIFDFYPLRVTHTFRKRKATPFAKMNPYNAALGGPITTPEEFFTDPAARKLAKRLLRYVAAR
ncbi:unnamed protein product, partial [marine sediment metagenome]